MIAYLYIYMSESPIRYHELFIYCKLLNNNIDKIIGNWGNSNLLISQLGVRGGDSFRMWVSVVRELKHKNMIQKADENFNNKSIKNSIRPKTTRMIRENSFQILENKNTASLLETPRQLLSTSRYCMVLNMPLTCLQYVF